MNLTLRLNVSRLLDWSPVVAATLVLAVALAMSGCGSAAARPADPDLARQALVEALDSWQRGAAHDAAPVRVADEDWLAGARLVSYRVAPSEEAIGAHRRFAVELTLRDARGRAAARKAHYDVSTDPTPAVIRLDHD